MTPDEAAAEAEHCAEAAKPLLADPASQRQAELLLMRAQVYAVLSLRKPGPGAQAAPTGFQAAPDAPDDGSATPAVDTSSALHHRPQAWTGEPGEYDPGG